MRKLGKRFRIFNSLSVISSLVLIAVVLTTITGSASAERDLDARTQSLIHSHLSVPAEQPDTYLHRYLQRRYHITN